VRGRYVAKILAAVPELVVINAGDKVVGGLRNKQLEAVWNMLAPDYNCVTKDVYNIIRQWAMDR
jgi:Mor family transcriptional regulator